MARAGGLRTSPGGGGHLLAQARDQGGVDAAVLGGPFGARGVRRWDHRHGGGIYPPGAPRIGVAADRATRTNMKSFAAVRLCAVLLVLGPAHGAFAADESAGG